MFCLELNDAMPDSEMRTLFVDELDKRGVGLVSFNEICRCLLPAMSPTPVHAMHTKDAAFGVCLAQSLGSQLSCFAAGHNASWAAGSDPKVAG